MPYTLLTLPNRVCKKMIINEVITQEKLDIFNTENIHKSRYQSEIENLESFLGVKLPYRHKWTNENDIDVYQIKINRLTIENGIDFLWLTNGLVLACRSINDSEYRTVIHDSYH